MTTISLSWDDIDPRYWEHESQKWNTDAAFGIVGRQRVSHRSRSDGCYYELSVAEYRNGQFYIEDTLCFKVLECSDVLAVKNRHAQAVWMEQLQALNRARQIVSEVCGIPLSEVIISPSVTTGT